MAMGADIALSVMLVLAWNTRVSTDRIGAWAGCFQDLRYIISQHAFLG